LGTLKLNPARQLLWVLSFGLFDALTPIVGFLLGRSALDLVGSQINYLGPICFISYGIYILFFDRAYTVEENNHWIVLGIPMSFSLDNLVAGVSLDLFVYPPIVSAIILGLMSGLLAWMGLKIGNLFFHKLTMYSERIVGAAFILVALSLFIDLM
jgi:putative Mn2+ efflux pump MntP